MIRQSYIWLMLFVGMSFQSFAALDAPSLRCVSVLNNGDVELTWVIPPDPGAVFDSYQIYYATSQSGPYALLATVSVYTQTTYTHVGANGQTTPGFYYMVTVSDAPTFQYSTPGDTLGSMRLTAANPLNGTAPLNWTLLHNPPLTTSGNYTVFFEFPAGIWNAAGTSTVNSFLDTIEICSSNINYRIEQSDISGCVSVSSIDGDVYQNLIPPEIPVLDSVSVDAASQNAVLGWQQSNTDDTEGYIVYIFTGSIWTPVDTVWGLTTTFYEYFSSLADTHAESYCIAAIDSCGNTSPLTGGHTTAFLSTTVDPCNRSVQLSWSAYSGFPGGVAAYEIYFSENGNTYTLLAATNATTTSYTASGLTDNSTYCFYVVAIAPGGFTSTSNISCKTVNFPDLPTYVYIRHASVNDDGSVYLKWVNDRNVCVLAYALQRSYGPDGPWSTVDYQVYTATPEYVYTDVAANANLQPVYYRVAVIDSCSNEAMYSDTARTIYLSGNPLSDLTNELFWNDAEGWPTGAIEYRLYRSIDNVPDPAPVATFTPGINFYIDDVALFYLSYGLFTYRLEGIEAPGNPLGYSDTTWSNILSIQQIPRLFVANAFAPEGYNKTFCPLGVYIDHTSYSFIVFNELGEEMFNTTDFYECWDGTNDGEPAPCQVYHYILRLTLPGGQDFTKRGHITLIR